MNTKHMLRKCKNLENWKKGKQISKIYFYIKSLPNMLYFF